METTTLPRKSADTRALLLPYAVALFIAMALIQMVIALTGGQITLLAGVLTFVVAVGIAVWMWLNRHPLEQVRFGPAVAHAIAYVIVTTSFNAHALLRALVLGAGPDGFTTFSHDFLATPWFGATLIMSATWGIGLLIHLVGAAAGRGWED